MNKVLTVKDDALLFVANALARLRVTLAEEGNLCVSFPQGIADPAASRSPPRAALDQVAEELSTYYGRPLKAKLYPNPLVLLADRVDPVRILGALQGDFPRMAWKEALPWTGVGLAYPPTLIQVLLGILLSRTAPPSAGSLGASWWGTLATNLAAGNGQPCPETDGVPPEVTQEINRGIARDDKVLSEAWDRFGEAETDQTRCLLKDFIPMLETRLVFGCGTKTQVRGARSTVASLSKKLGLTRGIQFPQIAINQVGAMWTHRWAAVLWALAQGLGENTGIHSARDPYSPASLLTLLTDIKGYPGLFVSGDTVYAAQDPLQMYRGAHGLHNEDGPALQWRGGYEQYWLFNHPIPKDLYEARTLDYTTPEKISTIRDRGAREAFIRLYGYEAFIRDTAAPQVRPWMDPATGNRWTLLRSRYRRLGLDHLLVCEASAKADSHPPPGSAKTYTRVPSWYTSAKQAWRRIYQKTVEDMQSGASLK